MGRELLSSLDRLQTKRVAKDYYGSTRRGKTDDEEENKYEKLKIPRRWSLLLTLVCLVAVGVLAYPEDTFTNDDYVAQTVRHVTSSARSGTGLRTLHNVKSACRKSRSSMRMELKFSEFDNSVVTDCDLPKGASLLLGFLQRQKNWDRALRIGLVNIDIEEEQNWNQLTLGWGKYYVFPFEPVNKKLQWSDFYPEWIDEEDVSLKCPQLPMPSLDNHVGEIPHAVVVSVPCGVRDVRRLQILLAAATVASKTGGELEMMLVLIISECRPLLNLFTCDELLEQQDDLWLYQVKLTKLRQHLALPVGSCELSLHDTNKTASKFRSHESDKDEDDELNLPKRSREAYATLLHSHGDYVCGAIVAAHSIRLTGSRRELVALVDENISMEQRQGLQLAGWQLHDIERIRNPKSAPGKYNAWNYSKFRLWQLVHYDKIVYVDADLLVLKNLDFLFDMPELSATGNDKSLFNSGVMVIEPSKCTFDLLIEQINEIESYNGGDQGFLNEVFPWWHRIPRSVNFLKHFWSNQTKEREEKTHLFQAADPPLLNVIHFLGRKPWLCFRDYDCNWNSPQNRRYASDVAHSRWWQVHDSMSPDLQEHCLLRTKQKAQIEYIRSQAEAAALEDRHWRLNITDPRLDICTEDICNWKSMLKRWGKK